MATFKVFSRVNFWALHTVMLLVDTLLTSHDEYNLTSNLLLCLKTSSLGSHFQVNSTAILDQPLAT